MIDHTVPPQQDHLICPACGVGRQGSTVIGEIAVNRDMVSTRICSACGARWLPKDDPPDAGGPYVESWVRKQEAAAFSPVPTAPSIDPPGMTLLQAARDELLSLWHDLDFQIGERHPRTVWSVGCENVQHRIETLTRAIGVPADWGSVPTVLVETGIFQRINAAIGFPVRPDMAVIARIRAEIDASMPR